MRAALTTLLSLTCAVASAQRPDTPGGEELFRFDADDVVETFDEERVRVHYTRSASDNAVSPTDADASGVPDYVEMVAAIYEEALEFYEAQGFRAPLSDEALDENGGDARFDVYLVDFFGSADGSYQAERCTDGQCTGYMVQENDFRGYGYPSLETAVRIVGSHELFHAIQAAYDRNQGSVFSEGGATWATETFDPSLSDFESAIRGFLASPERPLDSDSGSVLDRFAYGSAIFFRFLEERYGAAFVRELMEGAIGEPWIEVLATQLEAEDDEFGDMLTTFARWNLFTGDRADPAQGYANGGSYAQVTVREESFPLEDERPRHFYAATRYYAAAPEDRTRIEVALVGDTAPLRTFVAAETDGELVIDEEGVDVGDATQVIVAVVNTARSGSSARGSVCAGDPEEVAACVARFEMPDVGPVGEDDAGTLGSDAGVVTSDAGVDAGAPPPTDDGGGCSAGGVGGGSAWLLLLVLLRRRRV